MPTTTTTHTRTAATRVTTHDLSLGGRAGAVLILLLICLGAFIVSFTTSGWTTSGRYNINYHNQGLWESCQRASSTQDYHVATQVLMCLALVGLAVAIILIFLYLFATAVSKYQILLGLVIDTFITFALMLIAIIVYGAMAPNVYWSYGIAVISTVLCLVAAIVASIQLARC